MSFEPDQLTRLCNINMSPINPYHLPTLADNLPIKTLGFGNNLTLSQQYQNKVNALSPIQYIRSHEGSGSVALDSSGNGRNGTYSGVTWGSTLFNGLVTPDYDGANDSADLISASLISAFNPANGAFGAFVNLSVANWESANTYFFAELRIDANNRIVLAKDAAIRRIVMIYVVAGVAKTVTHNIPVTPSGFVRIDGVWGTNIKLFYQGASVGTPVARGTAMAGTLTSARLGARGDSTFFMPGSICEYTHTAELTDPQVATLAVYP